MFKKMLFLFLTVAIALSACGTLEVRFDQTPAAIVVETLSAIPSITPILNPAATFTPEIPTPVLVILSTNTPVQTLAPLYPKITWENLGPSEQEILVDQQTNERITLSGYTFQATISPEADLANNVYMYYANENMASIGWVFMGGWGGTGYGIMTEFYNKAGYFLTIRFTSGQSRSIILWISNKTAIVPVLPAK